MTGLHTTYRHADPLLGSSFRGRDYNLTASDQPLSASFRGRDYSVPATAYNVLQQASMPEIRDERKDEFLILQVNRRRLSAI